MPNRRVIGWSLVLVLVFLGAAAIIYFVQTRWLHQYVLAKIIQKTQEVTGGRVEIGDYDFHWFGPRADVYRLVIRGTEGDSNKPLLTADRVSVGLRIVSILRGEVNLSDLALYHPVVNLQVSEDGTTNIPRPEVPKKDQRPVNIFDLAVNQLQIERGELYYNDRRVPIDAELHDVQTEIGFNLFQGSYDGSLRYRQGRLRFTDFNPFVHNLEVAFSVASSGIEVEQLQVTTDLSHISFRGNVTDYNNPTADGLFDAQISTQDLRTVLKAASLPLGQLTTAGSLRYQYASSTPFLHGLLVDGQLHSPLLAVRLPQARGDLRELRSHYRLEKGTLVADGLRANLLGGNLAGDFTMRHLSENPESRLKASVRSISLNGVSSALAQRPLDGMPIVGSLNGTVEATWHGNMQSFQLQSDAVINGSTSPQSSGTGSRAAPIPVNGVAHLKYDGVRKTLSIMQSHLRTPHTEIRFHGMASERSSIWVEASSNDLREIDLLVLNFHDATPQGPQPTPLGLQGTATISGQIEGSTEMLRFAGQLAASDLQFRRERVRLLRTEFELSPSQMTFHNGYLETAASSRIRFDFGAGLEDWDYSPSQPITLHVSTREFPVSELQHLLGFWYPITGKLAAEIAIRGSQLHPEGQGSVQLTQATLWQEQIQNVSVELRGNGDSLHSSVAIQAPAGNASGNLIYYPRTDGFEVQMEARDIQLDQLEAVRARAMDITGVLTLSGQGRGTRKLPQLEVTAQIPQLQVREHRMMDVNAQVSVAAKAANITLASKLDQGELQASANVDLTSDYDATAKLDASNIPLGLVLANYLPATTSLLGQTDIHASLKGPLSDPAQLEIQVEIPTFNMNHELIQLANATPIRLDYRDDVLTLQRVQMKGTGTDVQVEGTANFREGGRFNGAATGTVDLQLMQILRPQLESSGQVKFDIRVRGDKARPDIQGDVRIVEVSFRSPGAPLGAERLNGNLVLRNNRIIVSELSGRSGGGMLSASGSIILGSSTQFNLGLTANGIRLRYPYGVRMVTNGNLALTGSTDSAVLSGRLLIDRLSFTNDFDLATFLDQFRGASSPPPSQGFSQNLRLNVAILTTEALGLQSTKLSLQGSGNLSLHGTAVQPVILGRANLTGGEVFFLGHRYEVQNGVITLTNPFRTDPVVNLAVQTTVSQYNVNLNFVGPMGSLRTTYTSDPPLPPVDIINLLAFGTTATAQQTDGNTNPSLGAQAVLARGLSSQISGQVERLAGLSHLSIDPTIGGNQQNPGARLAIQQRITSKLLFTFAKDVTSTQSEHIQLEYQVNRGWSVRGVRDENGGYAIDVKRRKTF